MNMPKTREMQVEIPSPGGDFNCIWARNCEKTILY